MVFTEQIEEWISRIDRVTQKIHAACQSVDADALNWKPAPAVWSAAQVIEHILALNSSYNPIFDQLKSGNYHAPWTARLPIPSKMFGRMILNSVKPDNLRKTRTFPLWEPSKSHISTDVLKWFDEGQEKLKETVKTLEADLSRGVVISSPANLNVVYALKDAFEIIVTHEERHLLQLQRVLEAMHAARESGRDQRSGL